MRPKQTAREAIEPPEEVVIVDGADFDPSDPNAPKPGMIAETKNLYQGKKDDNGRRPWTDQYPEDLDEPAENAVTARYALLVKNVKSYDGKKKLDIESIAIQSPLLREALGRVLDNYPGVHCTISSLTFSPPFEPFIHRWAKFRKVLNEEDDPEAKGHIQLLYDILEEELHEQIKTKNDLIANGVITFDALYMLFEPGDLVISSKYGEPCAVRLAQGAYGSNNCGRFFSLSCNHVDWDGEKFGAGSTSLKINEFGGTMPITALTALPANYHPNAEALKARLVARGREFEKLAGYHYKQYTGVALGEGQFGGLAKYNVQSRVIIDAKAWNKFKPNEQIYLSSLSSIDAQGYMDEDEDDLYDEDEEEEEDDILESVKVAKIRPLTNSQLLLCTTAIRGYSLKDKKWLTFFIGNVSEIVWNAKAFEQLVLPEDHKDLILALTESQRDNKSKYTDIIGGKNLGMILLLAGPPGVGKTLTAEAVADNLRAPLYMMSAGDLGTQAHEVENNLSNVLEMCQRWDAVLLLDEADVFLEARSTHDLERNKLVSIFLRILEYYSGCLFLTTNRIDNIDDAFHSRIHISLKYQNLSVSSRRVVWKNFLEGNEHGIREEDLDVLSQYVMNGRECKNVLKTAGLLAAKKQEVLQLKHVQTVLSIEKRYEGRSEA